VADVTCGSCQPVHGLDPGTPAPLGAAVKLYVLDALGHAVAAGTVRWSQPLTVTAPLKSLPAGKLQDEPDGTRVPVLEAAAAMISLSDNTATVRSCGSGGDARGWP
jgi:beta-lactamase class A